MLARRIRRPRPLARSLHALHGAGYDFNGIKPELIWAQEKRDGGTSVRGLQLGILANLGPHLLRASIGDYRIGGGAPDANWRKLDLGYAYNFSKRTMLYASAGYVRNGDGANRAVAAQGMAVPVNTLGHSATGYEIGLRHFFWPSAARWAGCRVLT